MKYEKFQFKGQKNPNNVYYFTSDGIVRAQKNGLYERPSNVSLNYLLSDEVVVRSVEDA
jgi:hypothetical protein